MNIHPTKTEIKFENESAIWPLVMSGVREGLGKFNIAPSIDFDSEGASELPAFSHRSTSSVNAPEVTIDPNYNPFEREQSHSSYNRKSTIGWENLYEGFESSKWTPSDSQNYTPDETETSLYDNMETVEEDPQRETDMQADTEESHVEYMQFKNKYIITPVKSGLMCIDQHRAHVRILYDQYMSLISRKQNASQQMLFPEIIELTESENMILGDALEDLQYIGFDLSPLGKNTYSINGTPANMENGSAKEYITNILASLKESRIDFKTQIAEQVALSMAKLSATPYGRELSDKEMMSLVNNLLRLPEPNFTPDNKAILKILPTDDIEKGFK